MRRRSQTRLAFACTVVLVCVTPASIAQEPFGSVEDLFADLPWVMSVERLGDASIVDYRIRSIEALDSGVHLRSSLTIEDLDSPRSELRARLRDADPDIGLSYAWDLVVATDVEILHLHAACTFSEANFEKIATRLLEAYPEVDDGSSFWCRCGEGCQAGTPGAGK